ncbi:TonB-dependent receptor [Luteimonas sp. FCS-9]|uniref:TonB-dependent receptor plug domain-containing protein n=1 Tax=Luteimonas sp. FCS-9 TaxID=1547516 RepID=UPI00063EC415|nr:TonB-dependent receptor [Luteimonas sp. FCS-9]KLJ00299.1 hypothetical protein WQ56_09500 [Luteimonas sp. FCS-9]
MSRPCPLAAALALALTLPFTATAEEADRTTGGDVFTLGQVTVTAKAPEPVATGDATITREEMWSFNTLTLDDAVKLTPGVMTTRDGNGRRNEHDIFVRGFGRWQVPLSIDGVRIYLPADNRLDFRRFLTADLAQVQIKKGYVSVIDGPGAMGGAINLVTRKPVRAFEGVVQAGVDLDRDGDVGAWNSYASFGTRRDRFYAQASFSVVDRDHWTLPSNFEGSAFQPRGERVRSASRDTRTNLKLGFEPNATDEYSLNYTRQEGAKGAPLHLYTNPGNRFWDWPKWDIETLYFLSSTQVGDGRLKVKAYYNTFDNALHTYDDETYATQATNRAFRSLYADESYGASVEYGFRPAPDHDTRLAVHWRTDRHDETSHNRPDHPTLSEITPTERNREDTLSLAAENTWHATRALDVLVGASYDRNEVKLAQDWNATDGLFERPVGSSSAWNGQAAVYWQADEHARFGATLSSRVRFATNFERYSTRFGTALPNPDLGSERGTHLELSWERRVSDDVSVSTAVFYADVSDMIQTVVIDGPNQITQTRNVGNGEFYGVEFGGQARVSDTLVLGGNATWMHRTIEDALQPEYRPTGVPDRQALLYATWSPLARWSFTPSVEYANDRWSTGPTTDYLRTGAYTLANLQVQWDLDDRTRVAFGGRNLFDDYAELAWGLPQEGRAWYAKVQFVF